MSSPGPLMRPYQRLVRIQIRGRDFEVPDSNMVLRCLQFLAPEDISYGRFCWNEDCQYCRVSYHTGDASQTRIALACKLVVKDGIQITEAADEIRYCLRSQGIPKKSK